MNWLSPLLHYARKSLPAALLAAFANEVEGFCKVDQVNLVDPVEVVDLIWSCQEAEWVPKELPQVGLLEEC